jgi:hypothetical protein
MSGHVRRRSARGEPEPCVVELKGIACEELGQVLRDELIAADAPEACHIAEERRETRHKCTDRPVHWSRPCHVRRAFWRWSRARICKRKYSRRFCASLSAKSLAEVIEKVGVRRGVSSKLGALRYAGWGRRAGANSGDWRIART